MTYGEGLQQAPLEQRIYYVYMWMYKGEDGDRPFYIGKGSGNRWRNRSSRSKIFKEFASTHECYSIKCAINLTEDYAYKLEEEFKRELVRRGITLIDAEHCPSERRRIMKEGIAAMPIVDGKRVSSKSGRGFGRPKEIETVDIEKFLELQKEGKMSVTECCRQLGISRQSWYNKVNELAI